MAWERKSQAQVMILLGKRRRRRRSDIQDRLRLMTGPWPLQWDDLWSLTVVPVVICRKKMSKIIVGNWSDTLQSPSVKPGLRSAVHPFLSEYCIVDHWMQMEQFVFLSLWCSASVSLAWPFSSSLITAEGLKVLIGGVRGVLPATWPLSIITHQGTLSSLNLHTVAHSHCPTLFHISEYATFLYIKDIYFPYRIQRGVDRIDTESRSVFLRLLALPSQSFSLNTPTLFSPFIFFMRRHIWCHWLLVVFLCH